MHSLSTPFLVVASTNSCWALFSLQPTMCSSPDYPLSTPCHPPPLNIPAGTAAAITMALKEQHTEQKHLYNESDGIKNTLKQKILNAFDTDYLLADLIDRDM